MFNKLCNLKLVIICTAFIPLVSSTVLADHYRQHYKTVITKKQVYYFKNNLCSIHKHYRSRRHHHPYRCRYWRFNNDPSVHYRKRSKNYLPAYFRHQHYNYNVDKSGLIGAAIGGILGNTIGSGSGKTAAIIGGVIAGAIIGKNIANTMDHADRLETNHTLETARVGTKVTWINPDSGLVYTVQPTRTYQNNSGRYCREYTTWVKMNGSAAKVYGTACRLNNGKWKSFN